LANKSLAPHEDGNKSQNVYKRINIPFVENNIKLTADEIRKFKQYQHLTDEEAQQLSEFLALYSIIIYNSLKK
jgi:hypothetical protein